MPVVASSKKPTGRAPQPPAASPVAKPPPQRLDRSRHAAPQVFEKLREAIVSLELAPGSVLQRIDLAERFGISQTPVRDALMRLGEEGLVDIFPQHATVVSRISIAAAKRAHFLRKAIELEIVATLAEAPAQGLIAALRELIARQEAMRDAENYAEFSLADQAFHRRMYEAAGQPELWDLVRRLSGHVDRLRRLHLPAAGKMDSVIRDHKRIVDAIARRDPALAQTRLRQHLSGTLGQVDEIRARHAGYVTD
jgi:DNA-binding GntR family transcriptional regulator